MSLWFESSKAELKPGPDLFPPKWTIAIAISATLGLKMANHFNLYLFFFSQL